MRIMSVGFYKADKFTAYFYPNSIVICTNLQCFKIKPINQSHALIDELSLMIARGEVCKLDELLDYNGELIWLNTTQP